MAPNLFAIFGGCCGLRSRQRSEEDGGNSTSPLLNNQNQNPASPKPNRPQSLLSSTSNQNNLTSPFITASSTADGYGTMGVGGGMLGKGKISEEKRSRVEEIGRDVGGRMMSIHSPFTRILTSPKSTRSSSPSSSRRQVTADHGLVSDAHQGGSKEVMEFSGDDSRLEHEGPSGDHNNNDDTDQANITSATSSPLSSAPPSPTQPLPSASHRRLPSTLAGSSAAQQEDNGVRKVSLGLAGTFGSSAVGSGGGDDADEDTGYTRGDGTVGVLRGGGKGARGRGRGGRGRGRGGKK